MTDLFPNATPRAALTRFVPGPYQPRRRFPDGSLAELAASIKALGVVQPILVRPAPGADLGAADFRMEIVSGERRWRASQIAGEADIPFILRDLSTGQVLQMQMIENVQREDLHPLDEAHGYDLLMHPPEGEQPMSIEQIAEVCGKSVTHVRSTVTLCLLVPTARERFEQGVLSKAIALRLASMPPTIQPRALDAIEKAQAAQGGKPLTASQANELLAAKFMLQLKHAPFSIESADLVPAAGACRACPKRTGANPDLFADVPSADTCTDPDCYDRKVTANNALRVAGARQMGQQVLDGAEALALLKMGPQSDQLGGDYIYLDRPAPELTNEMGPLQKSLKGWTPQVLILHPTQHTLRPIATVHLVRQLLEERGLLIKPKPAKAIGHAMDPATTRERTGPASQTASAQASEQQREQARTVGIERMLRKSLFGALDGAMFRVMSGYTLTRTVRQQLALHLADSVAAGPDLEALIRAWSWDPKLFEGGQPVSTELARLIAGLDDDEEIDVMITMLLCIASDGLSVPDHWRPSDPHAATMLTLATSPEFAPHIDLPALRTRVAKEWDARHAPKREQPEAGKAAKGAKGAKGGGKGRGERAGKGAGKGPGKGAGSTAVSAPGPTDGGEGQEQEEREEPAPSGAQGDGEASATGLAGRELWVGAFVRRKRTKPIGQVVGSAGEDLPPGVVLVAFDSPSEPGTHNLRPHAVSELELLPDQPRPQ